MNEDIQMGNTAGGHNTVGIQFKVREPEVLRGDAQLWYSQKRMYEAEELPQDWDDLKVLLRKEFVPINSVIQARDKLASLVQGGSVTDYINEFRRLKLQIPD